MRAGWKWIAASLFVIAFLVDFIVLCGRKKSYWFAVFNISITALSDHHVISLKKKGMKEFARFPTTKSAHPPVNPYSYSKGSPFPLYPGSFHFSTCFGPTVVHFTFYPLYTRHIVLADPQTHQAHSSFRPLYFVLPHLETLLSEIVLIIPSFHSVPCSNIIL